LFDTKRELACVDTQRHVVVIFSCI